MDAWKTSRDATPRPGRAGIDKVSVDAFRAKLNSRVHDIHKRLSEGTYGFSKLHPVFIPKADSQKERLICIPTVQDRMVQRAIAKHLEQKNRFKLNNSVSFGFIRGESVGTAVNQALKLRAELGWVLKTDITAFFDSIVRQDLKDKVSRVLGRHSLVPLLHKLIDTEVRPPNERIRAKLETSGIRAGLGVRQGMPLSPFLANVALLEFDREVKRLGFRMVRYADDMAIFFGSRRECEGGLTKVEQLLWRFKLSIPSVAYAGSKTAIIAEREPLDFLGREIVFLENQAGYVWRVGARQLEKIKSQISTDYSPETAMKEHKTLSDALVALTRTVVAYLGAYKGAHNFSRLDSELRHAQRCGVSRMFDCIFGQNAMARVSARHREFLGYSSLGQIDPIADIDGM
jgi:RNA-directed DNA polymerase